ncbi:MAG: hypothetical protein EOO16_04875 [Chitinophagaceae bacterium]|nr:MAG: hypothetical protein EOO16_04875 [Chitinophagaceae bacterium]
MNNNKDGLYFIVEEGQFNLGDFGKAKQMIELAGKTGATAIEFQLAYADDFYIKAESGHAIYKTREFSDAQLQELVDYTHQHGLQFVATCLSHKLVPKMASFGADRFNVNASDINNAHIVDAVVATGRPFFVATPLATEEEIAWVVARIRKQNPEAQFVLLHGQHSMASGHEWVEPVDTSLGYLKTLKETYGVPVGFIDHTKVDWMPAAAVAAGASVISKHITMSAVFQGPDWAICLEPPVMKEAIARARAVHESMQVNAKHLAKGEDLDRTVMRRSVVALRPIAAGKVIESEDIGFKRPGTGIAPDRAETIVGKKATRDISEDELFSADMFQ